MDNYHFQALRKEMRLLRVSIELGRIKSEIRYYESLGQDKQEFAEIKEVLYKLKNQERILGYEVENLKRR